MSTTLLVEELDDASRDYLLQAAAVGGRKMPGVYCPGKNSAPGWNLFLGILLVAGTLIGTLGTDLIMEEPAALAMLQTAGCLLGGWMILAAFRSWMQRPGPSYLGYFAYADGDRLTLAEGSKVTFYPLEDLRGARVTQNYKDGSYQNSQLEFWFGNGTRQTLPLKDERGAANLTMFLDRLAFLNHGTEGAASDWPSIIKGGMARQAAKTGEFPDNFSGEDLAVAEIPPPEKANGKSSIFLNALLIFVAGAGMYFAFKTLNAPARDDKIFEIVKSNPRASNLRAYLIDERNTAHRAEVEQMLASRYANALRLLKMPGGGRDPELSAAFCELVKNLETAIVPVVTLRVKGNAVVGSGDVQKKLIDDLSRVVGEELIVFGEAVEGVEPLIDVSFDADSATIAVRPTAEAQPVKKEIKAVGGTWQPAVLVAPNNRFPMGMPAMNLPALYADRSVVGAVRTALAGGQINMADDPTTNPANQLPQDF